MQEEGLFIIRHSSVGNTEFDVQKFIGCGILQYLATQAVSDKYRTIHELIKAKKLLLCETTMESYSKELDLRIYSTEEVSPADTLEAFLGKASFNQEEHVTTASLVLALMRTTLSMCDLNYKGMLHEKHGSEVFYVTKFSEDDCLFYSQVFDGAWRELGSGSGKRKKAAEQNAAKNSLHSL